MTSIERRAFFLCYNLTSIEIPNSVTSIGDDAFRCCLGLTKIAVSDDNTVYDSREECNAIIETATNTLIAGCQNTVIPSSVTTIGSFAFDNCSGLTSIEIPNSVTSIGRYAFQGCTGLTSITIPNSVTAIGDYAFVTCTGLTSVTIGNSVTSIGDDAFYDCNNLTSITSYILANQLTETGNSSFGDVPESCILYVPKGTKETYAATEGWNYFDNIIEKYFFNIKELPKVSFNIVNARGGLAANNEATACVSFHNASISNENQKNFAFVKHNDKIYLYNVWAEKFMMKDGALSATLPIDNIQVINLEGDNLFFKYDEDHVVNIDGHRSLVINDWGTVDEGNTFELQEVDNFDPATALATLNGSYTITYNFMYDDNKVAEQVTRIEQGANYPALSLPWGIVATGPTGTPTSNETINIECTVDASVLPFVPSATYDDANMKWYYLKFHSDNGFYLHHDEGQNHIDLGSKAIDNNNKDAYTWAFIGDPFNGYKIVNRAKGNGYILSSSTTMAGTTGSDTWPIMTEEASLPEGNNTYWIPTSSSHHENGFFLAQKDYPANRMNDRGKLAYWTDGAGSGSTFWVEERPIGPVAELEALIATAEALKTTVTNNQGTAIGKYSAETLATLTAAINAAKAIEAGNITANDVATLQAAIDAVSIILPAAGKYYQFHSSLAAFAETKAVHGTGGNPGWKTLDNGDVSFYWEAVETGNGIALQNAANGKYLYGNAGRSGAWSLADSFEGAEIDVKIFSETENEKGFEYGIILNGFQMHANGHNGGAATNGNIVSWNTDAANSASSWYIVEVEKPTLYTVTYNFKFDDEVKYTQTVRLLPGSAYPEMNVQLPYGVTSDFALPEGSPSGDVVKDFNLTIANPLPFEAAATGEPAKWYYLKMNYNRDVSSYIQDTAAKDGSIEFTDKSFAAEEKDSHMWGFAGNIWDGFVVVNKATNKAVNSTGSGAATMVDVADATKFVAWNSIIEGNNNWFCLKTPAGNFLNGQDGKVQHWNANDPGSSFLPFDATDDFSIADVTPAEPVESLKEIKVVFAREVIMNLPAKEETAAPATEDTTTEQPAPEPVVVLSVLNEKNDTVAVVTDDKVKVNINIVTITLETEITIGGTYKLVAAEGVEFVSMDGENFDISNAAFEVKAPFAFEGVTPSEEEIVEKLEKIVMLFNKEINVDWGEDVSTVYVKDAEDNVAATISTSLAVVSNNTLTLQLESAITSDGVYTIDFPANVVKSEEDETTVYEGGSFTFKVQQPLEFVRATPNEAVKMFEEVVFEFNKNITLADDMTDIKVKKDGTDVTTIPAQNITVEGNKVTLTLPKTITDIAVFTVTLPEGTVKGAVHDEPYEEEVTATIEVASLYTVTYLVDGEVYATKAVEYGAKIPVVDTPVLEGYTFSGWSEIPATMPAEDITVEGSFAVNSYTVTYIVDGEVYETFTIEYGKELTPIAEPEAREGYTFSGWSEIPERMPANNITIEGRFTEKSYTITYVVDGEVYVTETVEYGTEIELLKAPSKEGYTFVKWQNVPETMPANDVELTAEYKINSYTVTFKVDGKTYESSTFEYAAEIVTPADDPVKEGYTFIGWKNLPSSMPAEDIVITAIFEVNSYTVTFMVDGEEYKVVEVEYGARVPSPAAPVKEGHKFAGWDGVPSSMPAEDIYVEAKFTVNSYTVTFKVDGKTYKKVTVEYGTEIELPEEPEKVGRTFIGWDGLPETMPAENITLEAMFEVNSYTVTFMWGDEVYAEVSVEYGAKIELPATPEIEGHTFISWNDVPRTMPAEDVVVTANFKVNSYIVTFMIDGKVYKTMSVQYGAVIEVPEPTKNGYTFDGWSYVPATMPAENITVTGSFTQIETGIDQVLIDSGEVIIYDLNGLRIVDVHELKRGVYIINGKKEFVK